MIVLCYDYLYPRLTSRMNLARLSLAIRHLLIIPRSSNIPNMATTANTGTILVLQKVPSEGS